MCASPSRSGREYQHGCSSVTWVTAGPADIRLAALVVYSVSRTDDSFGSWSCKNVIPNLPNSIGFHNLDFMRHESNAGAAIRRKSQIWLGAENVAISK